MAKVALRVYNKEIEGMVESGQLDEAIAHCHHVLNTFPKNLETYRLLGKAYLEAKRYNEATDIFERLLMAVPDDFVAHVGMSIIHDEQNNMDAAIWHMERAFEVQPANAAIQVEMQRLYGRRDGVEPPKIRLTRGALAHMYVQGDLHPQAISEINSVLEEDPNRQDMQVLLSRAYFHSGQNNEAADICSQLLRRYPYCFDANRVLIELVPESERKETTQSYRHRVNELDPYCAFVSGSVFNSEEVADIAITLEKLIWDGQPVDLQPEWSQSLGIDRGKDSDADTPDWLNTKLTDDVSSTGASPEPASQEQDPGLSLGSLPIPTEDGGDVDEKDIPDFMRQAGWSEKTDELQGGSPPLEVSTEETPVEPIAEGELPDWIQSLSPSGDQPGAPLSDKVIDDISNEEIPDWLQGVGGKQDELSSSDGEQSAPLADKVIDDISKEEAPDWLQGVGDAQGELSSSDGEQSAPLSDDLIDDITKEDAPDWLQGVEDAQGEHSSSDGEQSAPLSDDLIDDITKDDVPDWLQGVGDAQGELSPSSSQVDEQDTSDWLDSLKPDEEPLDGTQGQDGETSDDIDSKPDWLKSLQPEEQIPPPDVQSESARETPAVSEEPVQPVEAAAPSAEASGLDSLGTTSEEQDEGVAWLEGLAAKQGAKPEELVTDPEARKEELPLGIQAAREVDDQVEGESSAAQETPAVSEEPVQPVEAAQPSAEVPDLDSLGTTSEEQEDGVAWLEGLAAKQGAKPEELVTDPEARKEEMPDWIQAAREVDDQAEGDSSVAQETPAVSEEPVQPVEAAEPSAEVPDLDSLGTTSEEQEDGVAWLEGLAAKQGAKPEELVTDPEARKEEMPDWIQAAREVEGQPEGESPVVQEVPPGIEESVQPVGEAASNELEDSSEPVSHAPVADESTPEADPVKDDVDLIQNAREVGETLFAELEESQSDETLSEDSDETGVWLRELGQEAGFNDKQSTEKIEIGGITDFLENLDDKEDQDPQTAPEPDATLETVAEEESGSPDEMQNLEQESVGVDSSAIPTTDAEVGDLPAWLSGLDDGKAEPIQSADFDENLPDWLNEDTEKDQDPAQPEPTAPTDWKPLGKAAPDTAKDTHPEETESKKLAEDIPTPKTDPVMSVESEPISGAEPEEPEKGETESGRESTGTLSDAQDPLLMQAQSELNSSNISAAVKSYSSLIKKGKLLDEVIFDLREALYRFPVEVSILQTLGDAYMRANRLQDALDSYTKAEELLR